MNKLYCLIIMFITCRVCEAQNLVLNGNLEQYSGCPLGASQIDSALFWTNPCLPPYGSNGTESGSSDYFNSCSPANSCGVPLNSVGYQPAHSGNGYAGFYVCIYLPEYREYAEVALSTPLIAGVCYQLQLYTNLANISTYAVDTLGIYFSDTLLTGFHTHNPLPFFPQLQLHPGYISDTLNWILLSGIYTAVGGESYMTIGNFNNDATTNLQPIGNAATLFSYLHIDDVSLIQVPPCNTGINESNADVSISINPNPFETELTIDMNSNELSEFILYDITSRKLLQLRFTNSVTLSTEQLAKGIYLYEVRNKNGVIKKGKIVKD